MNACMYDERKKKIEEQKQFHLFAQLLLCKHTFKCISHKKCHNNKISFFNPQIIFLKLDIFFPFRNASFA